REDTGRGIGVYARELIRALAGRQDLALTLWFEPSLPPVPNGMVPPGATARHYLRSWLPLHERLATHLTVPLAAAGHTHAVFHWLAHVHAPALPPGRTVVTVHDLILEQLASLYPKHATAGYTLARRLEASAIRRATVLVTDSEATRRE